MARVPGGYWDRGYGSGHFRGQWHYDHPSQELVALVAAGRFRRGDRALDLGCGAGTDALFLARCGFEVTGVDLSRRAIAIARRRALAAGVEVGWQVADVRALPIRAGSVALASDRGCLHHLPDADRPRYAAELHRVLSPGGVLLLRGCARDPFGVFEPVTPEAVARHFDATRFHRGPVLPIALAVNAGYVAANLVVLEKAGARRGGTRNRGR